MSLEHHDDDRERIIFSKKKKRKCRYIFCISYIQTRLAIAILLSIRLHTKKNHRLMKLVKN